MNEERLEYLINKLYYRYLEESEAKELINYINDLQQRIDKAIEYNNHLIEHAKYHLNLGHLKKMKKILLGDSNE